MKLHFFIIFIITITIGCTEKKSESIENSLIRQSLLKIVNIKILDIDRCRNPYFDNINTAFFVTIKNTAKNNLVIRYSKKSNSLSSCIPHIIFYSNKPEESIHIDPGSETVWYLDDKLTLLSGQEISFILHFPYEIKKHVENKEMAILNFQILLSKNADILPFLKQESPKSMYLEKELSDGSIAFRYPLSFSYWIQNDFFFELNSDEFSALRLKFLPN